MPELKICASLTTTKARTLTYKFVQGVREEIRSRINLNVAARKACPSHNVPQLVDPLAQPEQQIENCEVLRKVGSHECIFLGRDKNNVDYVRFIQADGSVVSINRKNRILSTLPVVAQPEKPKTEE